MKLKGLIEYVDQVKPNAFTPEVKTVWVNEIEGMIQEQIMLLSPADIITYDYAEDAETQLLIPAPHTKLYYAYLQAMIDFAVGEYNNYANTMELFNRWWNEYAAWYALRIDPASGDAKVSGYYLSAYAIAVKHGYTGTEEEWAKVLIDAAENARRAEVAVAAAAVASDTAQAAASAAEADSKAASEAAGVAQSAAGTAATAAGVAQASAKGATEAQNAALLSAQEAERSAKRAETAVPEWARGEKKPEYTAEEVGARPDSWTPSASDVGADPAGTAGTVVSEHNVSDTAHNDIRLLVEGVMSRFNTILDSDDTTLDQMSELVEYIKDNRELIELVTTGKVSVSDIVDNLVTNVGDKPLSAAQGVALKALIDAIKVPTDVSAFTNDAGYIGEAEFNAVTDELSKKIVDLEENDSGATEEQIWQIETNKQDIADIKEDLIELSQIETPKIVSSVYEMADTTKHYVNQNTGTIWANTTGTTTTVIKNNEYDPSYTTGLNLRLSTNDGTVRPAVPGRYTTDYIEITPTTPYNVTIEGLSTDLVIKDSSYFYVFYYDASKAFLGYATMVSLGSSIESGTLPMSFDMSAYSNFSSATYVRISVHISTENIATADCDGLVINFEPKNTVETTTGRAWNDTGIPYTPTFKTDLIGVMGENNVIYLSDNALPSGTYTLKYGDETYDTIGSITVE